jgi:glutathione reductase (NADPH)
MVDTNTTSYDYIVIGAGSGGMGSGRRAAMYGKKVLMIENRVIGGTCVNVGCVPKKVMFNLANFLEESHLMKDYGVHGTEHLRLDFKEFKAQRDAYVKRLNGIYERNLKNSQVDYIPGTAKFVSDHVIEVEGKRYAADHILIASGSYPVAEGFPGSEFCITSDGFFEMSELPKRMVCIGGGYIGVECAQIMAALGVKVTLVVRSMILKQIDRDIIEVLMKNLEILGVEVRTNSPHKTVAQEADGTLTLHLDTDDHKTNRINTDCILIALGRPPLIDNLCLENTGVKTQKGVVVVDEYQNTSVEGVYAIGDVTDNFTLTPVAIRAGRILSERLFNGKTNLKMLYRNIATVIFSHPPIGSLGMSEAEAIKAHGETNIITHKSTFINMFYSPARDQEKKQKSMFKIICLKRGDGSPANQVIVGIVGIGKGIDEML